MENIINIGERIKARGPTTCPRGWGHACPPGRAPYLVAPLVLHRPRLQLHIFTFGEKKIREKDSLRFTIRMLRPGSDAPGVTQLFATVAMSFACVLHFAMSSAAFHLHVFQNLHPFGSSRFSPLSVRSPGLSRAPVAPLRPCFVSGRNMFSE